MEEGGREDGQMLSKHVFFFKFKCSSNQPVLLALCLNPPTSPFCLCGPQLSSEHSNRTLQQKITHKTAGPIGCTVVTLVTDSEHQWLLVIYSGTGNYQPLKNDFVLKTITYESKVQHLDICVGVSWSNWLHSGYHSYRQ